MVSTFARNPSYTADANESLKVIMLSLACSMSILRRRRGVIRQASSNTSICLRCMRWIRWCRFLLSEFVNLEENLD